MHQKGAFGNGVSILMQFGLPSGNKKVALVGTAYRKRERKFCRISQIFIPQAHFKLSFLHKPPRYNPDSTAGESLHYVTLNIQRFSGVPFSLSLPLSKVFELALEWGHFALLLFTAIICYPPEGEGTRSRANYPPRPLINVDSKILATALTT